MTLALEKALDKSLAGLAEVAAEAEAFLAAAGVGDAAQFKVQLALEETVRNLIEHAAGSRTDRIHVRLEVEPGQVVIILEDDGLPFDPLTAPAFDPDRPLAERQPHGMGVHLLRQFTEEMRYEHLGAMNRLRLVVSA